MQKLLALPVFCAVVLVTRIFSFSLPSMGLPIFRTMLTIKLLLLVLGATLAVHFGPFTEGDAWQAVVTGMVLVSAMAIQNAAHRIHLGTAPPTTLMTGTTTQIMIDVADILRRAKPEVTSPAKAPAQDDGQRCSICSRLCGRCVSLRQIWYLVLRRPPASRASVDLHAGIASGRSACVIASVASGRPRFMPLPGHAGSAWHPSIAVPS